MIGVYDHTGCAPAKVRRVNPNWGHPIPPARALPTEFELRVTELRLTPKMYTSSAELHAWYERNRNRMCAKLGIRIIAASSPQAKGRVERAHGTHQNRLVKKRRLAGIANHGRPMRIWRSTVSPELKPPRVGNSTPPSDSKRPPADQSRPGRPACDPSFRRACR